MSWAPMAYDNPDSPNKGLAKRWKGLLQLDKRCGDEPTARFCGCVATSPFEWNFPARANTKLS